MCVGGGVDGRLAPGREDMICLQGGHFAADKAEEKR